LRQVNGACQCGAHNANIPIEVQQEKFMPKPLWIVVANASIARCFERTSRNEPLKPLASYEHPESRQHMRELEFDRPGRAMHDDAGRVSFVPRTEPKERERTEFARELAKVLDEAVLAQRCSGIALFVSNPFLGELQSQLSRNVQQQLTAVHPLDLTSLTIHELEDRVTKALAPQ
jgi:protein required for attachment to host cells